MATSAFSTGLGLYLFAFSGVSRFIDHYKRKTFNRLDKVTAQAAGNVTNLAGLRGARIRFADFIRVIVKSPILIERT